MRGRVGGYEVYLWVAGDRPAESSKGKGAWWKERSAPPYANARTNRNRDDHVQQEG